jgi:hypothetical protein
VDPVGPVIPGNPFIPVAPCGPVGPSDEGTYIGLLKKSTRIPLTKYI